MEQLTKTRKEWIQHFRLACVEKAAVPEGAHGSNWCRYVLVRQFDDQEGWELQNMLTVAEVIVQAALERRESRGVHLRVDYPDLDESWRRHLTYERLGGPDT